MSESRSLLGRFFGLLWLIFTFVYRSVVLVVFLALIGLIFLAVSGGPQVKVEDNVALVIAPQGELVERVDLDPGERFLQDVSGEGPSQTAVRDLVEALDRARDDKRINMAVLKLDLPWWSGLGPLHELNLAIDRFKAAGKPVYVHGGLFDQQQYLVAAHADDISLDPMGLVWIDGFSAYGNYFKEGLDKLGVKVHVFRVGEYKSAVEPFLRNDMSEEAKAANREWLGDLWRNYREEIAAERPDSGVDIENFVETLPQALPAAGGDSAQLALDAGLVNRLETLTQYRQRMAERVGLDEDRGSFRQIAHNEYLRAVDPQRRVHGKESSRPQVGVVVVQGEIVDGRFDPGTSDGETTASLLDDARYDDKVDAVVLRIDSPGGSVFASETIRRAVQALREAGKPVVASMSSVAASGGYWIAMDADQIWANNTTITGSIGIFGLLMTLDETLGKLGIHTDGVGTTELAGALRGDRPLSPAMEAIFQAEIDHGYRTFIEGVAAGRKLPVERVDEIARGRVWSGEDALQLGLVDQIGSFDDAVRAAANLAKLEDGTYDVEPFEPEPEFPGHFLFDRFGQGLNLSGLPGGHWLAGWLAQRRGSTNTLRWLSDPRGQYAYCPCTPGTGAAR